MPCICWILDEKLDDARKTIKSHCVGIKSAIDLARRSGDFNADLWDEAKVLLDHLRNDKCPETGKDVICSH